MITNDSMKYYLKNAFDYELRNSVDLQIDQLTNIQELSEEEQKTLESLLTIKEHLTKRMEELKV